ncbi:hypothetical protein KM043_004555 [Ampulex compressa]|nr:hypothetical protein KM043_004555 [Ampulex compressa]
MNERGSWREINHRDIKKDTQEVKGAREQGNRKRREQGNMEVRQMAGKRIGSYDTKRTIVRESRTLREKRSRAAGRGARAGESSTSKQSECVYRE